MEHSSEQAMQRLDVFAGVLIRCFIGGMVLLLVWFFAYAIGGDGIYALHSKWFQMPRQTFAAIHYAGMAFMKILLLLLFLLPYAALKLVLRKKG